jgi:hypothetical protein
LKLVGWDWHISDCSLANLEKLSGYCLVRVGALGFGRIIFGSEGTFAYATGDGLNVSDRGISVFLKYLVGI